MAFASQTAQQMEPKPQIAILIERLMEKQGKPLILRFIYFSGVVRHRVLRAKRGEPTNRVYELLHHGDRLRSEAVSRLRTQVHHRRCRHPIGDWQQELLHFHSAFADEFDPSSG